MTLKNPLLDCFLRSRQMEWWETFSFRNRCIGNYSFAVPTDNIIQILATSGPLIEMGAGRGYWAWLIEQAGGDIIAVDTAPPGLIPNYYFDARVERHPRDEDLPETFVPITQGGAEVLDDYPDRTLFICWGSKVLEPCLERYKGDTIFIVEEECTDNFFEYTHPNDPLYNQWTLKESHPIPVWDGLHDIFNIYTRKNT